MTLLQLPTPAAASPGRVTTRTIPAGMYSTSKPWRWISAMRAGCRWRSTTPDSPCSSIAVRSPTSPTERRLRRFTARKSSNSSAPCRAPIWWSSTVRASSLQRTLGDIGTAGQFAAGALCACRRQRCHRRGLCAAGGARGTAIARFVHFNIWRAISKPPQDVPLAVCDARSVHGGRSDCRRCRIRHAGQAGMVLRRHRCGASPAHRWHWFPDMTRDEALVFKTNDSDLTRRTACRTSPSTILMLARRRRRASASRCAPSPCGSAETGLPIAMR